MTNEKTSQQPEDRPAPQNFIVVDEHTAQLAERFKEQGETTAGLRVLHNDIIKPYFDRRDKLVAEDESLVSPIRGVGMKLGGESEHSRLQEEINGMAGLVSGVSIHPEVDGHPGLVASLDRKPGKSYITVSIEPVQEGSVIPGHERRFLWDINQPDEVYEENLISGELTRHEISGPRTNVTHEDLDPNAIRSEEYEMTTLALQTCAQAISGAHQPA